MGDTELDQIELELKAAQAQGAEAIERTFPVDDSVPTASPEGEVVLPAQEAPPISVETEPRLPNVSPERKLQAVRRTIRSGELLELLAVPSSEQEKQRVDSVVEAAGQWADPVLGGLVRNDRGRLTAEFQKQIRLAALILERQAAQEGSRVKSLSMEDAAYRRKFFGRLMGDTKKLNDIVKKYAPGDSLVTFRMYPFSIYHQPGILKSLIKKSHLPAFQTIEVALGNPQDPTKAIAMAKEDLDHQELLTARRNAAQRSRPPKH